MQVRTVVPIEDTIRIGGHPPETIDTVKGFAQVPPSHRSGHKGTRSGTDFRFLQKISQIGETAQFHRRFPKALRFEQILKIQSIDSGVLFMKGIDLPM